MIHSHKTSYSREAYDTCLRGKTIASLINLIKSSNLEFDAIAMMGMSQLVVGSIIANALGKGIYIIRKKGESSHAYHTEEGAIADKYIIIDDFIGEGKTLAEEISRLPDGAKCVGLFFYTDHYATAKVVQLGRIPSDTEAYTNAEYYEQLKDIPAFGIDYSKTA